MSDEDKDIDEDEGSQKKKEKPVRKPERKLDIENVIIKGYSAKAFRAGLRGYLFSEIFLSILPVYYIIKSKIFFGFTFGKLIFAALLFIPSAAYVEAMVNKLRLVKALKTKNIWHDGELIKICGTSRETAENRVSSAVDFCFEVSENCYKRVITDGSGNILGFDPVYSEKERKIKLKKELEEYSPDHILNKFTEKLSAVNDRLPGEEISEKLYALEKLLRALHNTQKKYPQISPELEKLTSYYMPSIVKMTEGYAMMEENDIVTESVTENKKKIEDFLDTTIEAMTKLYDRICTDIGYDADMDMEVLNSLYAHAGIGAESAVLNIKDNQNTKNE